MTRWVTLFRRLLAQPDFLVAVVVLGIAAAGLGAATEFLQLHFKKEAVSLTKKLNEGIPPLVGEWVQVTNDEGLKSEVEEVLGTDQYINRTYVDRRQIEPSLVEKLKDMGGGEREQALSEIIKKTPEAVMHLHVAYYTGKADTVAHIPDRCYVADGFEVSNYETEQRQFGLYPSGKERAASYHYINFEDQTGEGRMTRNVAYLFHVNGHYESDALGVRRSLQNLIEKYGYYAKVELMTQSPSQAEMQTPMRERAAKDRSLAAMDDFFAAVLPGVEKCLPDWDALHAPRGK